MYLFGASGHAKVIIDTLRLTGHEVKGFYDDDPSKEALWEIPVLGKTEDYNADLGSAIIAIGNNAIRKDVAQRVAGNFGMAIHPDAFISPTVILKEGTVVMAGAIINADAEIGRHCIINTASSIDHDCQIGDYVHIAPNASLCGGITVGEGTLIGAGATICPNLVIGKWSVIGAGSVVIANVPDNTVVVGNPAKML